MYIAKRTYSCQL